MADANATIVMNASMVGLLFAGMMDMKIVILIAYSMGARDVNTTMTK